MSKTASLFLFLVVVLGGGTLIGLLTGPDDWFRSLHRPSFAPPDWVFAPVWTVLYLMIAVAGWKITESGDGIRRALLVLWCVQLVLNFSWTPLFFAAHRIGFALADIIALLAVIVAFIVLAHRGGQHTAAWLMTPYAAWVAFAAVLNGAYARLNVT